MASKLGGITAFSASDTSESASVIENIVEDNE